MKFRWRVAQFFEINWWKNYLGKKDKTEYLAWKKEYWLDFLKKTNIQLAEKSRILDAGCGPAGIFIVLDNHDVDALDPLLKEYEQHLPHFSQADYQKVHFIAEPLENFENPAAYDVVFCLNAINHVADLGLCFEKLASVTKPNGLLALSVDAHKHAFLKPIFKNIPGDVLHPHQYDLKEYQDMVEQHGFVVQDTQLIKSEQIFDYYLILAQRK